MYHCQDISLKVLTLLFVAVIIAASLSVVPIGKEQQSPEDLFQFEFDQDFGHLILSNETFPLHVYILSLPDVGNYRLLNNSAFVEGAFEAAQPERQFPYPPSYVYRKAYFVSLFIDLAAVLKVDITCSLVNDWNTYKDLVESSNNSIIVNSHDEYLPVPSGYSKEAWTDRIADFMLNRWGTWTHVGGYPFYRVWYENGTTEEWGEKGFQQLMGNIGNGHIFCQPPASNNGEQAFNAELAMWMEELPNYFGIRQSANIGFPLNELDINSSASIHIYEYFAENGVHYWPGAVVRFDSGADGSSYGFYVHVSSWLFDNVQNDRFAGLITTASAVYSEFGTIRQLFGHAGSSAAEAIQKATNEGRLHGLDSAQAFFHLALIAYSEGNYKLAGSYAEEARISAEIATSKGTSEQAFGFVSMIATSFAFGALIYVGIRERRKAKGCNQRAS
jgi:hypothetical protein